MNICMRTVHPCTEPRLLPGCTQKARCIAVVASSMRCVKAIDFIKQFWRLVRGRNTRELPLKGTYNHVTWSVNIYDQARCSMAWATDLPYIAALQCDSGFWRRLELRNRLWHNETYPCWMDCIVRACGGPYGPPRQWRVERWETYTVRFCMFRWRTWRACEREHKIKKGDAYEVVVLECKGNIKKQQQNKHHNSVRNP